jgi:hypothetical protein
MVVFWFLRGETVFNEMFTNDVTLTRQTVQITRQIMQNNPSEGVQFVKLNMRRRFISGLVCC